MQASSKKKNISLEPNCKISFSEGARQETLTPLPSQFNQLEHFCSISPICACQMSSLLFSIFRSVLCVSYSAVTVRIFLYFPYFGQFCLSVHSGVLHYILCMVVIWIVEHLKKRKKRILFSCTFIYVLRWISVRSSKQNFSSPLHEHLFLRAFSYLGFWKRV